MKTNPLQNTSASVGHHEASFARVITAIVIGNGFITYDFVVYSLLAGLLGTLFFPSGNALVSLLASLATFGAGFVMRPVGAVLIGRVADRRSRKAGLTLSLALMTVSTWLIACLPTYASIGSLATVLMVVARLLQGLAAGGEIGPASASLMEAVAYERRCAMVSWRGAGQGLAAFLAASITAGIAAMLSPASIAAWGWRIPFVLGGLIGPVGWYLRRHMPFIAERGAVALQRESWRVEQFWPILYGIFMVAATSASFYVAVFYMPSYLVQTVHWPATGSLLTSCLSGLVILVMTPLIGALSDRFASRKTVQYVMLTASLLAIYPAFWALTHGAGYVTGLIIIAVYVAMSLNNAGANSVLMLEAFPRHRRSAALAVIYSTGVVIFGGFSPFLVTWLIHLSGDAMTPAWYLMAATLLTLFGLYRFPGPIESPIAQRQAQTR